jgi:hypothetical protein
VEKCHTWTLGDRRNGHYIAQMEIDKEYKKEQNKMKRNVPEVNT